MNQTASHKSRLLLIDTVGDAPGAVLTDGDSVLASADFPLRSASAILLTELKRMFSSSGIALRELNGIGVISGPGSFTGVRTGLAMAKGLCEVAALPLASVSRLQVLAEAAELHEGFAVLDAGRSGLYVREQRRTEPAPEFLCTVENFEAVAAGAPIVVAEQRTAELLDKLAPALRELRPVDLLNPVRRCLAAGGTDVALADANYLLAESEIYKQPRTRAAESDPRG
ncbi:MAG TPA: tRNA (adenosine(37)-N6)-threonylcarbamoyltransferase complex dimerization subunit type 1 TsaB [Acidobacteriaceae bacterium]